MHIHRLAAALVLVSACTHHRKMEHPAYFLGEDVTIEASGAELEGVVIAGPGHDYYVVRTERGDIPFGGITKLTEEKTWLGALEGLGLGVAGGVAVGIITGFASGDDNTCDPGDHRCHDLTAGSKAVLGGVIFGALGGVLGLAVGTIRGSQFVYEF